MPSGIALAPGYQGSTIRKWLFALVALFFALRSANPWSRHKTPYPGFEADLAKCALNDIRPAVDYQLPAHRLEAAASSTATPTVLRNATLIDGDGSTWPETTIVFQGDVLTTVCHKGDTRCHQCDEMGSVIQDLAGCCVTPGLVDMHSHVGVREVPEMWATDDVNEVNFGPITPWARAIDGLKPHDRAMSLLVSGGVTTSLVITGSKNLISGEGVVIKPKNTSLVHVLAIDSAGHGLKGQRYLKMAGGENIKSHYGQIGKGPSSRLGESYLVRKAFQAATDLKDRQDRWCAQATRRWPARARVISGYPEDLELQTLVDVMRGDVRVNAHSYEPQDVTALYDHADQFGFNVTALHHALEAHRVLDQLIDHNTMLATFSDEWGFKKEVYRASSYMLKAAADRGIPIALTTDHPAKSGQLFVYEAQIANHFGLPANLALASLFAVPSKALGIDNRVGYVREGYDADLVIWDQHPLRLGARPLQVFLEGDSRVNASLSRWRSRMSVSEDMLRAPPSRAQQPHNGKLCSPGQRNMVVRGIQRSFLHGFETHSLTAENFTLVIECGAIRCFQADCEREAQTLISQTNTSEMDLSNGHLLPGMTLVTRNHGLSEISSEPSTSDGSSPGIALMAPISSQHGLSFGGGHLERAHRAGLTRLITPPRSSGFLHGVSALFRPGARHSKFLESSCTWSFSSLSGLAGLEPDAIVQGETALHFTIGHNAKSSAFPTISSQISRLSSLLSTEATSHEFYHRASNGDLPVVIHTGNRDIIAQVIALKQSHLSNVQFVIMGGSEAHFLSHELAANSIPVIIAPWMCQPWSWDVQNCLPGPPSTDNTLASMLLDAGVDVALGNWDARDRYVRNALWEASWLAGPENPQLAVDLVSTNVERILGLPRSLDFVVYERSPFEFGASVALIVENGAVTRCWPDVE
ncbi:hypothetical protein BBP40_010923 [Aspergillus hancockii]|nr:hypothetical protein BBP40_010923 [Aspergillus hancockii]